MRSSSSYLTTTVAVLSVLAIARPLGVTEIQPTPDRSRGGLNDYPQSSSTATANPPPGTRSLLDRHLDKTPRPDKLGAYPLPHC